MRCPIPRYPVICGGLIRRRFRCQSHVEVLAVAEVIGAAPSPCLTLFALLIALKAIRADDFRKGATSKSLVRRHEATKHEKFKRFKCCHHRSIEAAAGMALCTFNATATGMSRAVAAPVVAVLAATDLDAKARPKAHGAEARFPTPPCPGVTRSPHHGPLPPLPMVAPARVP